VKVELRKLSPDDQIKMERPKQIVSIDDLRLAGISPLGLWKKGHSNVAPSRVSPSANDGSDSSTPSTMTPAIGAALSGYDA
jgi:hypothetical protein